MKKIQTFEDVYPAIEEIIVELKLEKHGKLSAILHHLMHQVAWTTRSELFDELLPVLKNALKLENATLRESIRNQMEQVVRVISGYLKK